MVCQQKYVTLGGNVWHLREAHLLFRTAVPGDVGTSVASRFAELRETRSKLEEWAIKHDFQWK